MKIEAGEGTFQEANVNPSGGVAGNNGQKPKIDDDGDNLKRKNKKNKEKAKAKLKEGEGVASEVQYRTTTGDKQASAANKGMKEYKYKPAEMRTFANGLVIEELEMGEPDGKRASCGSKGTFLCSANMFSR